MTYIDDLIEKANTALPYTGSIEAAGVDDKGRISFPLKFKSIFLDREKIFGTVKRKVIYYSEKAIPGGGTYLELRDYLTRDEQENIQVATINHGRSGRITFASRLDFLEEGQRIKWIGKRDHIRVYKKGDSP